MVRGVAIGGEPPGQARRQLRIDEEARGSGSVDDAVTAGGRTPGKRRPEVGFLHR